MKTLCIHFNLALIVTLTAAFQLTMISIAHGTGVQLYLHAPFDIKNRTFNLERLEQTNRLPYYSHKFLLPYKQLEAKINKELENRLARNVHIHVNCPTIFCPDTDADVTIHSTFCFTKADQPHVK